MKKLINKWFVVLILLATTVGFASCGDDDDDAPASASASAAVAGKYKGYLNILEIEDVTLTVEDLGNNKVRVTTDKGNTTPKEVTVAWVGSTAITAVDIQGILIYEMENGKNQLSFSAEETGKDDVLIFFKGERIK